MTPAERARRAQTLFEAALEVDASQRADFLKAACEEDAALREEVEGLLSSLEAAESQGIFPSLLRMPPEPSLVDQKVGPYHVLSELGDGGMGVVYLAERADEQFQKRVALKVVKRGMDASHILNRFRQERQILAGLEHPHIARLLDGGVTTDGRPYFVMEYVDGVPITVYCDRKRLSIEERLRLFRQACAAVQYAHQNLVVHRDLKPSNVLVASDGGVKLVDFGIAKLLNADPSVQAAPLTSTGFQPMTPEYAAPEQVRGEVITTATDVYALGILLCELLTGRRPYMLKSHGRQEIERAILDEEPKRPSTIVTPRTEPVRGIAGQQITPEEVSRARRTRPQALRRMLKDDLDNIVLMAIRKEPSRRYMSAAQLEDDLRRYLEQQPIAARPDTFVYRSAKFLRRHRMGVAAAGAMVISLLGGLGAAVWQNRIAVAQRDLAVQTATAMIIDLSEGLYGLQGPVEKRLSLLNTAADVFDRIDDDAIRNDDALWQRADAHRKLAITYWDMGEVDRALRFVQRAKAAALEAVTVQKPPVEAEIVLAATLVTMSDVQRSRGQLDSALAVSREAISLSASLAENASPPWNMSGRRWLHLSRMKEGDHLSDAGRPDDAAVSYEEALATIDVLIRSDSSNAEYYSFRATTLERIADLDYYGGDVVESCKRYKEAMVMQHRAHALSTDDAHVMSGLSVSLQNVGWCLDFEGRAKEAIPIFEESIVLQQRLLGADPSNVHLARKLMGGIGELGNILRKQGELAAAAEKYREAIAIGERFERQGTPDANFDQTLTTIREMLASMPPG